MHLFSSQGRDSISGVAWGAAGGPNREMGLLALLSASRQVWAAGQHLGQRPMCGQWGGERQEASLVHSSMHLSIGTRKRMWSSVRPRDLAKRTKSSFSSGVSSLVLP